MSVYGLSRVRTFMPELSLRALMGLLTYGGTLVRVCALICELSCVCSNVWARMCVLSHAYALCVH